VTGCCHNAASGKFNDVTRRKTVMTKIVGIILIVAGTLGLIYGGFSYTKDKHDLKIGTLQFSLAEKEKVNVPVWAGAGAIAVGVILLLIGRKP
jgi:drug/metabolite transporter (DMT)-like permease